jgi:hypothetical protein
VGAKTPTGQTVSLKKVFLHKPNLFTFSRSLPGGPNAVVVCCSLSSLLLVARHWILHAVIIRPLCCLPLSSSACCHRPPPRPSLFAATIFRHRSHHRHSAVSAFSCHPLLSFPVVVRRPILHDVFFRRYCCPPLLSLSTAAVFHCHSHHHHSAVSAVSHRPLLSFSIAVRRPILHVVVVCQRHHPLPLSSTIAVPLLVLPPTLRC